MTLPEKINEAIQWHEGMLLMPQHFQKNDRRLERLIHFHAQLSKPFYWGVTEVLFDPNDLAAGLLTLQTLEAVMPDGSAIIIDPSHGEDLKLSLPNPGDDDFQEELMVYAYLPKEDASSETLRERPRYHSRESEILVDETYPDSSLRCPVLKPCLYLKVGEKPGKDYAYLPLARLLFTDKVWRHDPTFSPPALFVTPNSPLYTRGKHLCNTLREKVAFLSERLHDGSQDLLSKETLDATKCLIQGLLPFETQLDMKKGHPFDVYQKLIAIAGYMSTLYPGHLPPRFSAYDHEDPLKSFQEVESFIQKRLQRIQEGYQVMPFLTEGRTFYLPMRPSWVSETLILGAKACGGMSMDALFRWIQTAVIASEGHVSSVREKRILGAKRTMIDNDEAMGLFPAQGVQLFKVTFDAHFLNPNQALQIFNVADDKDHRPEEIVLYRSKNPQETYL